MTAFGRLPAAPARRASPRRSAGSMFQEVRSLSMKTGRAPQ